MVCFVTLWKLALVIWPFESMLDATFAPSTGNVAVLDMAGALLVASAWSRSSAAGLGHDQSAGLAALDVLDSQVQLTRNASTSVCRSVQSGPPGQLGQVANAAIWPATH